MSGSDIQISRLILAIVFVISGLGKLRDLSMFASIIQVHLGLRSRKVSRALAKLTVTTEVIVAISLVLPGNATFRVGVLGTCSLLLAFTAVMTRNALRSSPLDCFCFGHSEQQASRWLPLVRLALLGLTLLPPLTRWSSPPSTWPTVLEVVAALLLCVLGTWFLTLPGIVARHQLDSAVAMGVGVIDLSRAPLAPITVLRRTEE